MIGTVLGGVYEITEKIGAGGMAVVYKAKDLHAGTQVAIKILRPDFADDIDFVRRFKREAEALAALSHPNIVNTFAVGQQDNIYYIVMEYVNGETLKEFIQRKGRMSIRLAVYIIAQLCKGLAHAHNNDVIHRDIKPQNILINREGVVKLADFGLAKPTTGSTETVAGATVLGSVHYFSPEQARGLVTTQASDIYSVGIVLYEMATGTVPFDGETPVAIALKHIQEKVPSPRIFNPEISPALEKIILKAVEKEPANRYASAEEMSQDLFHSLENPDYEPSETPASYENETEDVGDFQDTAPVLQDQLGRMIKMQKSKSPHHAQHVLKLPKWLAIMIWGVFVVAVVALGGSEIWNQIWGSNVVVPELVGLTQTQAEEMLKGKGLRYEIGESYDATVPKGNVVAQNPSAQALVGQQEVVDITLSKGSHVVAVPNVIGLTRKDAWELLVSAGLICGNIIYEKYDVDAGYVIRQKPEKDTQVESGTRIDLWISE